MNDNERFMICYVCDWDLRRAKEYAVQEGEDAEWLIKLNDVPKSHPQNLSRCLDGR